MWVRPIGSAAALALGVLLLATACGSGGGGSKDDAVSVTTTPATATVASKPVRSKAACLKLAQGVGEATVEISQGTAGTILAWDPLGDADSFSSRDVADDARKFALVAAGAPDEVKAQFALLSSTLNRLAASLHGIELDGVTPATKADHAQLNVFQGQTDRRQIASAQDRLTKWFSTKCPYY